MMININNKIITLFMIEQEEKERKKLKERKMAGGKRMVKKAGKETEKKAGK